MESTWLIIGLVNGAWVGWLISGYCWARHVGKIRQENIDLQIKLKAR